MGKDDACQSASRSCAFREKKIRPKETADKDKSGNQTDDGSVPEGGSRGDESLPDRAVGTRGGSDDGSRSHTGFIGKETAGDAVACGKHESGACQTSGESARFGKGAFYDEKAGFRKERMVHPEDCSAAQEVEKSHKRDEPFADSGYRAYAAQNDGAGDKPCDDADAEREQIGLLFKNRFHLRAGREKLKKSRTECGRDRVHLYGTAYSKGSQDAEDGEKNGRKF